MTINIIEALTAIGTAELPGENTPDPGDFEITKCDIEHGSGARYPIGGLIKELHLYEDIEKIGITGWLQLEDNANLIQSGVIIGEELLWLKFSTAGAEDAGQDQFAIDFTKHPLYIHKVEGIEPTTTEQAGGASQSFITYRLHFCSTDMVSNSRIRISKNYQGRIDDIVTKILEKDLQTKKPVEATNTIGLYNYTAPNIHPFDAVLQLTGRAQCKIGEPVRGPQDAKCVNNFKYDNHDYLFFETSTRKHSFDGGFFFIPLQRSLDFGQDDLILTLNNSQTTSGGEGTPGSLKYPGFVNRMLRSKSFDFTENGDKWGTVEGGIWAAKHIRHNSTKKSYAIYEHDYLEHLGDPTVSEISKTPVYWPKGGAKTISEYSDARILYSSSSSKNRSELFTGTGADAAYPWSHPTPASTLTRNMQLGHILGYQRVTCELWGNSGLQIGKQLITEFPAVGLASGTPAQTGLEASKEVWPDRNNNVWMITKLGHHIEAKAGGFLAEESQDPVYTTSVEMVNTFAATEKVLPAYGGLG